MVAPRRVIALPTDADQRQRLVEISRSRTEPTSRVERARIILAYLEDPSAYAVARTIGVTQQTVTRCLERAAELGVIEALDDRPRAGRDRVITAEAKTWLVALACRKAKELGYPHELWTTRLLAAYAGQHGPSAGHPSLGKLAQGTVCKILAEQEVKHSHRRSRPASARRRQRRPPDPSPMAAIGVRRDKAALSSGCKAHPAIRSSRKQSEQSWR
jgi:transposase